MEIKKTDKYALLKETGLKENVSIGNSQRTVSVNLKNPIMPKRVVKKRLSKIAVRNRNCSGCSRRKHRNKRNG